MSCLVVLVLNGNPCYFETVTLLLQVSVITNPSIHNIRAHESVQKPVYISRASALHPDRRESLASPAASALAGLVSKKGTHGYIQYRMNHAHERALTASQLQTPFGTLWCLFRSTLYSNHGFIYRIHASDTRGWDPDLIF